MPASATDKFTKSYSFLQKSLAATISDADSSLTLNNYTSIPTDTKVHFIIDRIDSNGNRTNSARELVSGISNGSAITNLSRGLHGTTAQSHNSGAIVEFVLSGAAWNDLIDGILAEHNQDGTHGAITTPSIIVDDGGTLDVDTINEATAANGVTIDGLLIKDSKLSTNDSVVTTNITDGAITNAKLNTTQGELGGVWNSYTPTVSASSNSFTSASATGRWTQIGKTVFFNVAVTLTTVGTGTGPRFTLPLTPHNSTMTIGGYRERAVGGLTGTISLTAAGSDVVAIHEYDNSQSLSNGMVFQCYGTYEAA